jgi:antitoxin YefM
LWFHDVLEFGEYFMKNITAGKAQENLSRLLEEIAVSHEPIQITSDHSNGVLIAEDDWRAIQETLYLLSIPGMRESIREGLETPLEECSTELTW